MTRTKKPLTNAALPEYPDMEQALIHRRKFFTILGGSAAAAALLGACNDKGCPTGDLGGPPFRTAGEPPALKTPPPTEAPEKTHPTRGKIRVPERREPLQIPVDEPEKQPKAVTIEEKEKKKKKKKIKIKPHPKLGGAPPKPDPTPPIDLEKLL